MVQLLIVAAFGLLLARWSGGTAPVVDGDTSLAAVDLPEDIWAAFDAVAGTTDTLLAPPRRALTTVGALVIGQGGYVSTAAALRDGEDAIWLDAAAVVHPTRVEGRIAIRRDVDGYHLQRHRPVAPRRDAEQARARVRIDSLFD
ncbi:MAG: hypothetical protein ABGZ36_08655 [Actinomycetota bacterium]